MASKRGCFEIESRAVCKSDIELDFSRLGCVLELEALTTLNSHDIDAFKDC